MYAIATFLSKIRVEVGSKVKNTEATVTINKLTNVISLTIVDVDNLNDNIMPFFKSVGFISRKAVDFKLWCVAVTLHKQGHVYTPPSKDSWGRENSFIIYRCINQR